MYIVGLTGGIASGKSTVSTMLKSMGVPVIDADQVAREIVEPGQPAYEDIVNEFGLQVVLSDGQLDRKRLGDIVFSNPELRRKLNGFTHPRLGEAFDRYMQRLSPDDKIVIWDVALLLETGMDKQVDEVWLVWVDDPLQVKRLIERDGLEETEAEKRIAAQMPMEEKTKLADRLIDNRGTLEETRATVTRYYKQLLDSLKEKDLQ